MRVSSIVLMVGLGAAAGYAAINPGRVLTLYRQIYPSNPYKQQALDLCSMRDPGFNRADSVARDACYQRFLGGREGDGGPLAGNDEAAIDEAQPNFIDFWRAGRQGNLSKHDIRALQQNQRYLSAAHYWKAP
jgi:hypothetical protein